MPRGTEGGNFRRKVLSCQPSEKRVPLGFNPAGLFWLLGATAKPR